MKICLQKSITVLTAHIRHTLVAIFEFMKEYTLEKNLSNVFIAQNLFLKKSIFKIIFVRILENVHFCVCIAIKGLPEKKLYKNMHVLLKSFSCNFIYWNFHIEGGVVIWTNIFFSANNFNIYFSSWVRRYPVAYTLYLILFN